MKRNIYKGIDHIVKTEEELGGRGKITLLFRGAGRHAGKAVRLPAWQISAMWGSRVSFLKKLRIIEKKTEI